MAEANTASTLDAVSGQPDWWREARGRLTHPGARKWYWGSVWGVIYLVIPVWIAWANVTIRTIPIASMLTALVVVIGAVYVVLPPLMWRRSWRVTAIALTGFFALTCLAIPLIGIDTIWFWLYVPIMTSFSWQSRWFSLTTIVVVVLAQLGVILVAGRFSDYWYTVALTASLGIMMFGFAQQIQTVIELRAAQSEIARLAVGQERARFSRDMHDMLGHSLTVVTVKSELARRLVSIDPARAETEIADVERLSRAALADLRSAVTGYREMSLSTELGVAQAALASADVAAHLPESDGVAAPDLREVFGWVLREGVTNVIRHSGAQNCWVQLSRASLTITDDGRGLDLACELRPVSVADAWAGNGLRGLAERADAAGARVSIGSAPAGGTRLVVERSPK